MKIEHTALYVRDLEGARAFFCTYFGASSGPLYHNPNTGFRSYFLTFWEGGRLELMTRPELEGRDLERPCTGYAHLAFSVGSREAVEQLTDRLRRAGYPVLSGPRTTGDGYYESCVAGVEGIPVEITI